MAHKWRELPELLGKPVVTKPKCKIDHGEGKQCELPEGHEGECFCSEYGCAYIFPVRPRWITSKDD